MTTTTFDDFDEAVGDAKKRLNSLTEITENYSSDEMVSLIQAEQAAISRDITEIETYVANREKRLQGLAELAGPHTFSLPKAAA